MRYDFTDLKLFLTLSKTLNLTVTAEHVALTPSAVSLRLKKLEEALGVQLFVREPRGVRLTPAGLALKPWAEKILTDLYNLEAHLKNFSFETPNEIRIASNSTGLQIFLADVIGSFLSTHAVRCQFMEKPSAEVIRTVLEGKADVGFGLENAPTDYSDMLHVIPYVRDRHVLITPKNHPLSHRAMIEYGETLLFPHITLLDSNPITQAMKRRALAAGHPLNPVIQVVSFELIQKLVASQAGIAVLPYSSFKNPELKKALSIIELSNPWADRPLAFFVVKNRQVKPKAQAFIDHAFSLKNKA